MLCFCLIRYVLWLQLYTTTTIVLVLQSLYYDYIYRWLRRRHKVNKTEAKEEKKPMKPKPGHESGIPIPNGHGTPRAMPRREFYYTSARSLAGSGTPPFRTYMRAAKSGPSAMQLNSEDFSSDDEATYVSSNTSATQPRPIPRSAAVSPRFSSNMHLHVVTYAHMHYYTLLF